jgi:putative ABC transport system permease protein
MAELESYVALLRRQYPDFTVYAVPQLAAAASNRDSVGVGVPMDMRRVTEVLSFMIAALLAATNLSILMLSRKNEIGILRALGATQWNIISMVLAESLWIAFLGSLIGGLTTQPAVAYQLLSNKIASRTVVLTMAANLGKLMGFSLGAAVLFGFLPVAKALRVTPAQVMRGE